MRRLMMLGLLFVLVGCGGSSTPTFTTDDLKNTPIKYTYHVEGTATGKASLTYQKPGGETEQNSVTLPHDVSFTGTPGTFVYLSAQKAGESGTITCEIRVGGKAIKSASSNAPYGIASCSGALGQ